MLLNQHIIVDEIADLNPACFLSDSLRLNLRRPEPYKPGMPLEKDVLYVANAADVEDALRTTSGINWLLSGLPNVSERELLRARQEIIAVPPDMGASDLYFRVRNVFDTLWSWYERMLVSIATSMEADFTYLDIAVEYFKNPILLLNPLGGYVKLSGKLPVDLDSEEWLAILENDEERIREMNDHDRLLRIRSASDDPIIHKRTERYSFVENEIIIDKNYYGKMCHCDSERPFTLGYHSMLKYLLDVQKIATETALRNSYIQQGPANYLIQYLRGIKSDKLVPSQLKNMGWGDDTEYSVIVAMVSGSPTVSGVGLKALSRTLESLFPKSCGLLFSDTVVLVVQNASSYSEERYEEILAPLLESDADIRLKCGISLDFYNLEDLDVMYDQGIFALRSGLESDPTQSLFFYSDSLFAHFSMVYDLHSSESRFLHPKVLRLEEHDLETGSEYVATFAALIECGGNKTSTAKRLFIHPNTLAYRLRKITELTGIDFKDTFAESKETFHFLLSCKLLLDRHGSHGDA